MVQIFCPQPPPPPASKGQNSTFSEYGHVAYKITHAASWKQIFYPQNPRPWGGVNIHFFRNMFMLHIKSNGVTYAVWVGSKFNIFRTISNYMESQMQHNRSKYFACRHPTPTIMLGSKGQNSTFSEQSHIA